MMVADEYAKSVYEFKHTRKGKCWEGGYEEQEVVVTVVEESLEGLCEAFRRFALACGFPISFNDEIGLISDEPLPEDDDDGILE